jgi:quercetin dioxygenase-like cupin family protein
MFHRVPVPALAIRILAAVLLAGVARSNSAPGASSAQDMPPGAVVAMESDFGITEFGGPVQVIQLVVELPPGAVVPPHIHGGPAYVTVLEGEVVLWEGDREARYEPGGAWIEDPRVPSAAANVGEAPVRLLATYLLAPGAPLTTLVDP